MTITEITEPGTVEVNQGEVSSAVETQTDPTPDMHQVKIAGKTVEVTQEELINGYMRQSDYTRKTTEAANLKAEAEQGILLMDALDRNSTEAIQAMVDHYNVNLSGRTVPQGNEGLDYHEEQGQQVSNPEIEALRQDVRNMQQQSARSQVDQASVQLAETYGASVEDIDAAKRHATMNGFPDIESAYQNLHFSEAFESLQRETKRTAEDERITQDKRNATSVVGTQTSSSAQGVETPREGNRTIRESFMETLDELNLEVKDLTTLV